MRLMEIKLMILKIANWIQYNKKMKTIILKMKAKSVPIINKYKKKNILFNRIQMKAMLNILFNNSNSFHRFSKTKFLKKQSSNLNKAKEEVCQEIISIKIIINNLLHLQFLKMNNKDMKFRQKEIIKIQKEIIKIQIEI